MVYNYMINIMMGSDESIVIVEKVNGVAQFVRWLYRPIVCMVFALPLAVMRVGPIPLVVILFVYIVFLFASARALKSPYKIEVGNHFTNINYSWFFWDKHIVLDNRNIEVWIRKKKSSLEMDILSTKKGFFQNRKEIFFIYSQCDNWTNTEIIRLMEIFQSHSVKVMWI